MSASGSLEPTHGSELGSSACRNGSEEEAIALPTWPLLPLLKGSLYLCQINCCHTLPSVFPEGRVNEDRWGRGRSGLEPHHPSNPVFLSTLKKPWQSAKGHQMSSQHARAEASTAGLLLSLPTNLSLWAETTMSSFQVKS